MSDPHIQRLPVAGRLLFIAHIVAADDEGRGDFGPEDWKAFSFPQDSDITEEVIESELLPQLWEIKKRKNRSLVEPYEVAGRVYWYLPSWGDYQKVDHPTPSKMPKPGKRLRPGQKRGQSPRPRNGRPPTPDQWDFLSAMAEERETTILKAAETIGITEIDQILARDVTKIRQALEVVPVANGKKSAEARVGGFLRRIRRAIQFDNLLEVSGIFEEVSSGDWTNVRAGVLSISSEYKGKSKAELFESIRRSAL